MEIRTTTERNSSSIPTMIDSGRPGKRGGRIGGERGGERKRGRGREREKDKCEDNTWTVTILVDYLMCALCSVYVWCKCKLRI